MKKLLILFMAFGLVATSCNNDKKANNDKGNTNRDKDDYNNNREDDRDNTNRDEDEDNKGGNWSSSEKRQWMNLCTSNPDIERLGEEKATNYCECILDKLQERYSTLKKADAEGGEQLGAELGSECARELGYQ